MLTMRMHASQARQIPAWARCTADEASTSLGSSRARAWRATPSVRVVATILGSTRSVAALTKDLAASRVYRKGAILGAPDVLALLVGELVHVLD